MIYLLETELPEKKSVQKSLRKIFGINEATSQHICKINGLSTNSKVKDLDQRQLSEIEKTTNNLDILINIELKKLKLLKLKQLMSIKLYRGLRSSKGYPVRGQRTHTNAKTARKNKRYR